MAESYMRSFALSGIRAALAQKFEKRRRYSFGSDSMRRVYGVGEPLNNRREPLEISRVRVLERHRWRELRIL